VARKCRTDTDRKKNCIRCITESVSPTWKEKIIANSAPKRSWMPNTKHNCRAKKLNYLTLKLSTQCEQHYNGWLLKFSLRVGYGTFFVFRCTLDNDKFEIIVNIIGYVSIKLTDICRSFLRVSKVTEKIKTRSKPTPSENFNSHPLQNDQAFKLSACAGYLVTNFCKIFLGCFNIFYFILSGRCSIASSIWVR
jgi:hypothetical protein